MLLFSFYENQHELGSKENMHVICFLDCALLEPTLHYEDACS